MLYFRKGKATAQTAKRYVPFIQMVPYIRVMFISYSIGSEVAILIRKTENVPINLQSLTLTKSKGRLKIIQDITEILHILH